MKMKLTIILLALFFSNGLFSQTQQEKNITTKYVSNEMEFIKAIANNTKIIIEADTLNLSVDYLINILGKKPYKNYFTPAKRIFFYEKGLVLHGFTNLSIIGKTATNLITENSDEDVITFENCKNIYLKNLNIYHTKEHCSGKVLQLLHSKNIKIEAVKLNGSGAIGANIIGTDYVWFSYTSIYNNSEHAIRAFNSKHISFYKTTINDNPLRKYLINTTFSELLFQNCHFTNNETESFINADENCITDFWPRFKNCNFEDNGFTKEAKMSECEEPYEEEDCCEEEENEHKHDEKLIKAKNKQTAIIISFFNYINKNPKADELLSYFPRENVHFFNTKATNQLPVFNYYFNNDYLVTQTEFEDIETIDYFTANVRFIRLEISEADLSTINEVVYNWQIKFDTKYRFQSVTQIEKEVLNTTNTGIPEFPKVVDKNYNFSKDYEFADMHAYHRIIVEDYFDAYTNASKDYFYTFHYINHRLSDAFYNPQFSLNRNEWSSKENISVFNQYFSDLKKFAWNNFYEEFKRVNKQKAIKFQPELVILFNNVWVSSVYQYYADKPLDIAIKPSKHKLNYPKIPNLKNTEVASNLNVLRIQHHNYAFVRGKYIPYDFEYLNNSLNNVYKEVTNSQDKKAIKKYLKDYKNAQKHIDDFMKEFYGKE